MVYPNYDIFCELLLFTNVYKNVSITVKNYLKHILRLKIIEECV